MSQLEHFRAETRAWLEENCPASMRTPMPEEETVWGGRNATYVNPDSKVWLDRMAAKGWTCPTWPAEYGGGGLSKEENLILLFQMDTDAEMETMWGDMGTAKFFISEEDLSRLDFSRVMFYWDAY